MGTTGGAREVPRRIANTVARSERWCYDLQLLSSLKRLIWLSALATGCQHDVHTAFPAGLEPLENNPIPEQTAGPYAEALATATDDSGYIHVYGRGYILADPGVVWQAAKTPQAVIASCTTDQQMITPNDEPEYEFSFLVQYTVNDILTVQWDDAWRYGTIDGTPDAPELAMIKHQKIDGSSFISRSEGTIEIAPAMDDPTVTEISIVEHLDAVSGSDGDVLKSTNHVFASLVALAHGGTAIPPCP
jgi:hypothetical protein